MTATSDEEMETLLSSFDQICDDFKNGITQIQSLHSNCNAEIKKREALEFTANSLKSDNERLTKLYTGSLNKLADQLERRTSCQSLTEQLERVRDEALRKETEYRSAMESLQQDHAAKIKDLETQISGFLIQKATNEATINQLHQDLASHKSHVEALARRLDRVQFDTQSRYNQEIHDLKDCLMIEQEEKNELIKQIQNLEKDLLISRTKLAENRRDLTSTQQVETLKQKIMKLRKENEVLKSRLLSSTG